MSWTQAFDIVEKYHAEHNPNSIRGISRGIQGYDEFLATTIWTNDKMHFIKISRNMMNNHDATIELIKNDMGPTKNEESFKLPTTVQGLGDTLEGMMKMFF